jgi:hypothetical protein
MQQTIELPINLLELTLDGVTQGIAMAVTMFASWPMWLQLLIIAVVAYRFLIWCRAITVPVRSHSRRVRRTIHARYR